MRFLEDPTALRTAIAPFDVGLVVVFGSHARASAQEGSDLDLGVLSRGGGRLDRRTLGALHVELGRWADREVDVVDLATDDAVFRFEVARDGRPLFESEAGAWKAFVARALIDHDDIAPFVRACVAAVMRSAKGAAPR